MPYQVIAPMVNPKDREGRVHAHYYGSVIGWLNEKERANYLRHNLVREVGGSPEAAEPFSPEVSPEVVAAGSALSRPNKVAPKEDWVNYVASLPGKDTAEVLDANFTKLELQDLADE